MQLHVPVLTSDFAERGLALVGSVAPRFVLLKFCHHLPQEDAECRQVVIEIDPITSR